MASGSKQPDAGKKGSARNEPIFTGTDFILKMVEDKKTEMYVKFAKVMVMCQGPYTNYRAKALAKVPQLFKSGCCFISDETYCKDTGRKCQFETTEEFYSYFIHSCGKALEQGNNLIVLDPTISNIKQNQIYMAMAYKMQYVFFVAPPFIVLHSKPEWPRGTQAFSFREVNNTPPCGNMFKHLFCAFYLHDSDSRVLRHEGSLYVKDCLENIPEFLELFSRVCPNNTPSSDDEFETEGKLENIDSMSSKCTPASFDKYFNLNDHRQDLAYCVIKIFRGMKDTQEYFKQKDVLAHYGRMSKLMIVGFIVTPYVIAARVKLTHNQRPLWDINDDLIESNEKDNEDLLCPSELVKQVKDELPNVDVKIIGSRTNETMVSSRIYVHEPENIIHDYARGRSCHIVLGKAPNAHKHNIDYDVAFALTRERNYKNKKADVELINLDKCVAKRLGKFWFIYLKELLTIDGFLTTCCIPFSYDQALQKKK